MEHFIPHEHNSYNMYHVSIEIKPIKRTRYVFMAHNTAASDIKLTRLHLFIKAA